MDPTKINENFQNAPRKCWFHVVPRYSGGSPGMVEEHIAHNVALDELESYDMAVSGVLGEKAVEETKL